MSAAFISIVVISLLDKSQTGKDEAVAFADQYVRSQTGLGAESAVNH